MQIHSGRHAKLEVDYIHNYGALEDRLSFVRPDQFQTSADVDAWKDRLQKDAPAVFAPLGEYFQGRATRQKIGIAATLIPMGLAAASILQTGLNSGNMMLGLVGFGLNVACQIGLSRTNHDTAALFSTQARFHRDTERTALYLQDALARQSAAAKQAPAAPAPAPAAAATPAAPAAPAAPVPAQPGAPR